MVEALDSNILSTREIDSSSITALDRTIEEDGEYTLGASIDLQDGNTLEEYTFSAPIVLQDIKIQNSSSGDISEAPSTSTVTAEEEAEHTAYTPEALPEQYSPDVYIQTRERSREIIGTNITLPYETEGVITEPSPPP